MAAIEERNGGAGADTKGSADALETFVVGQQFQARLRNVERLLALAGGEIDAGQIDVVIAVVKLQIEGPAAKLDGRPVFFLHQGHTQTEVRQSGRALRIIERRGGLSAVDLQEGGERLKKLSAAAQLYGFVDFVHCHQISSRERRRRTNFSILSRSSSAAFTNRNPYLAIVPTNSARRTSASICSAAGSPGR